MIILYANEKNIKVPLRDTYDTYKCNGINKAF